MDKLYFSVVIPTYKDSQRLKLCLDGLARQKIGLENFEVIVVNNDPFGIVQIDEQFFNKLNLKVLDEKTPGSYAARNLGIQHASAKILALTDSDCIPDPDWLSNAISYFENDKKKEIGILAGNVPLFFKDTKSLTYAEIYEKYTGFDFQSYVKEGSCGAGNWFSYKSILEEFGGFNPKLKSNGDTDLSKRIASKYKVIYAPDVVVRHPARYQVAELVYKYRRLIGGTYQRKFQNRPLAFLGHTVNFTWRRAKFAVKKIFTVHPKESWAISVVCVAITWGAWLENFALLKGQETKR